ncbi:drug resistance transporter, EmrB/QacA subfamily [Pseudonocardia thermophila]|uniref:Drug resistance transporter, EmrB/QacA subfamily n=1 Tax=Pseudonocardia thermophila TaxID=1848 RepID=A0A1M6R7X7_PSETH|nr:MDR family MFS transporter [Pseudonocardia thermophila]SHK28569.1 drug resistance transporter, EmrB/QacA subfamily [Pseudonocardia thermophila]
MSVDDRVREDAPVRQAAEIAQPTAGERGWILPMLVLVAGMFMSILDTTIVNVAVVDIQRDFGATTDQVQWIATAYTLAEGVVVPVSAWLGLRFGMKRVYNIALVLFAAGSVLCGLAWSLDSLIVFRVVQAIPGGVLPAVTLTMVYALVPKDKIGQAMAVYGLGVIFAPALGPVVGGYLVEYVDWRLIFFINLPIGVLGALAAVVVLPSFDTERAGKFDLWGFAAIATSLGALLLALEEGSAWGWTSGPIVTLFAISILSLALFVVIELEVDEPLLDVRVFLTWQYTNSLLLIAIQVAGLFAVVFYVLLFLQQAQGLGAFEAGLMLLPQALAMAVVMPVAGLLYDRIGPRWLAVTGLAISAYGTFLMHDLTVDTSRTTVVWLLVLRAVGLGLAMMPIMGGGVAAVPPHLVPAASAYNNVVQRASQAFGLAVLTAFMTNWQASLLSGRAALVPAGAPAVGPAAEQAMLQTYQLYARTQTQVFVDALDQLMLVTSALTAVGIVLALFLRSGPSGSDGPAVMMH